MDNVNKFRPISELPIHKYVHALNHARYAEGIVDYGKTVHFAGGGTIRPLVGGTIRPLEVGQLGPWRWDN